MVMTSAASTIWSTLIASYGFEMPGLARTRLRLPCGPQRRTHATPGRTQTGDHSLVRDGGRLRIAEQSDLDAGLVGRDHVRVACPGHVEVDRSID